MSSVNPAAPGRTVTPRRRIVTPRRRVVAALAGVAVLAVTTPAVATLAAGTARAAEPASEPPCQARPILGYLRGDLTTADGKPGSQFTDSWCPGRLLRASLESGFHYIVNTGVVEPNADYVAIYTPVDSDRPVHEDVATAGEGGELRFPITDVSRFMRPGEQVTVRVLPAGRGLRPTAVEYAVMLAL